MWQPDYGKLEVAQVLLFHGADPSIRYDEKKSLHLTEKKGHKELVELLRAQYYWLQCCLSGVRSRSRCSLRMLENPPVAGQASAVPMGLPRCCWAPPRRRPCSIFLLDPRQPRGYNGEQSLKEKAMAEPYPIFLPSHHFMDKAVKWLLRHPRHVQELLEYFLPHLVQKLDFSTLQLLEPSQISPEFQESTSDLFFTLKSREEKRTYVIHFIVKHQSRPLPSIRFRFQKAQMGIWTLFEERQRGKREK